jgi:SAM-dependent methyltransferase
MSNEIHHHKEPDEIFFPLSNKQYAEFYSIEMDGFTRDIEFYQKHCAEDSKVLELGCGTGRISRALTSIGCSATGLDLSLEMLRQAKTQTTHAPTYLCMDMTQMAFLTIFDHILIPYNTLNLLKNEVLIKQCLQQTWHHLKRKGTLLLQLHIPDTELIEMKGKKRFQFQIFTLPHVRGKLIKETLRWYCNDTQNIHLEERYRVRLTDNNTSREDFSHTLQLAGFSEKRWLSLLKLCGFQNLTLYGDYNSRPFQSKKDPILLVKACRS